MDERVLFLGVFFAFVVDVRDQVDCETLLNGVIREWRKMGRRKIGMSLKD